MRRKAKPIKDKAVNRFTSNTCKRNRKLAFSTLVTEQGVGLDAL